MCLRNRDVGKMKTRPLPYLQRLTDRIGVRRFYYRHLDYRVTLPAPTDLRFASCYQIAADGDPYPRSLQLAARDLERPTSVYVLHGFGHVKIGVAINPAARLQGLNIGSPVRATLEAARQFPCRATAIEVETTLHREFRSFRANGEWFAISVDQAKHALMAWGKSLPIRTAI